MKDPFNTARPRSLFMAAGLFLCVAILGPAVRGQDETIRIDTNLVTVPLSVLDKQGRYVPGLAADKFRVFEDGVEQKIEYFAPSDEPVTVFLLIDISDSVRVELPEIARAATQFVQRLRLNDSLMAATFSWRTEMLFSKTKVADLKMRLGLRISEHDPETLIYDAVRFAQNKMKKETGRSAIIVLSDGMGSGLAASAKGTLKDAEEQKPIFYSMHFGAFRDRPFADPKKLKKYRDDSIYYLTGLAERTGGRYFRFELIEDLDKTFDQIADELRQQYTLGYYSNQPGNDGERRKITVKVNVPNVAVRSRNEVVYKKPKK